jgi:8-oxo-dGTP pyrophosphatase MutT (NUDIX family)
VVRLLKAVGECESADAARQAAVREPYEETGIQVVDLTFVTAAVFDLRRPERRELPAIY